LIKITLPPIQKEGHIIALNHVMIFLATTFHWGVCSCWTGFSTCTGTWE